MFKEFWKIDPSQGESRFAQLLGILLLCCLITFLIWHFEGANRNEANGITANQFYSKNASAELEKINF